MVEGQVARAGEAGFAEGLSARLQRLPQCSDIAGGMLPLSPQESQHDPVLGAFLDKPRYYST